MGNVNMDSSQIHYKKSAEYNNVESALTQALQNGSEVSIAQAVTSGTELATVTIDGTGTKIYAPTIPAEKHLEWVTVATSTADTTNASQFAELYTVYSALSDAEKALTRLKHGNSFSELLSTTGLFAQTRPTASALRSYGIRIDTGNEYYIDCVILTSGSTFTNRIDETESIAWELQILRLVDNE